MLVKVNHVNYEAHYAHSPPVVTALVNTDHIQSVTEEDSSGHRVMGPLIRIRFHDCKEMICQNTVEDLYVEPRDAQ